MKWRKPEPRPYYAKYEKVSVRSARGWFEVYRLPHDVYAIAEPQHMQEANVYLVIGGERALLLDSGMGICDIRPLVRELYGGEVILVNSHCHLDHIAGNHLFQPAFIFDEPHAKRRAGLGAPKEALGNQLEEDMFLYDYPAGFDPAAYRIPPYEYIAFQEGHVFDLGGRKLRALHTPGHSEDGVMLYDAASRQLFTGDTFYLGALYAFFSGEETGNADLHAYRASLERVAAQIPESASLLCSHNEFATDMGALRRAAAAFAYLTEPDAEPSLRPDGVRFYEERGIPVRECFYEGERFSIICRNT